LRSRKAAGDFETAKIECAFRGGIVGAEGIIALAVWVDVSVHGVAGIAVKSKS